MRVITDMGDARQRVYIMRKLLIACLLLSISACGFQLRGSAALPEEMSVTFVKTPKPWGTLLADFSEALRNRNVTVTDNRDEATAILTIIRSTQDKDVLSVDGAGKVLEFQLSQTILFAVKTGDNIPLLEPQSVSMVRDFLFNSTDVLSKDREEAVIRSTMQRELVNLAILRMTAAVN